MAFLALKSALDEDNGGAIWGLHRKKYRMSKLQFWVERQVRGGSQ